MTKPILFNTEEVRATLDGRKTAKRLVCKITVNGGESVDHTECVTHEYPARDYKGHCVYLSDKNGHYCGTAYPPYRPGDILYVRETWFQFKHGGYAYRADSNEVSEMMREDLGYKWRSSTTMPREAARIWLRVTDVRVERLLQGEADVQAQAEGCSCVTEFLRLWNRTIKPADRKRYGWEANPWVWTIEFERCEKPEEAANG